MHIRTRKIRAQRYKKYCTCANLFAFFMHFVAFKPLFGYFLLCTFCTFNHFVSVSNMVLTFVYRHAQKSGKPF